MQINLNGDRRRQIPLPVLLLLLVGAIGLAVTFLLSLPISSADGEFTDIIAALFTAISALTVTGLNVVDSASHWSLFGQIVLCASIFLGGLGFITSVSFLLISFGQYVGLQGRGLIREDIGGSLAGALPTVRNIAVMAIVIQALGAAALFIDFYIVQPLWIDIGGGEAFWQALFHSVSAFNNAGFEIMPDELVGGSAFVGINNHYFGVSALMILVLLGGLGYPFLRDVVVNYGRFNRFNLDTKLVLVGVIGVIAASATIMFLTEFNNPDTLGGEPMGVRALNIAFEATAARTSGLTTVDHSQLTPAASLTGIVTQFIGGVTASTAGGIKINTFMVVVLALFASAIGREHIKIFRRSISSANVRRALILFSLGVTAFFVIQFAMLLLQPELDFLTVADEAIAALSTSGWSAGATSDLNAANRIVLIIAMLLGRYGPLMLALNFLNRKKGKEVYQLPNETVRIG